MSAVSATMYQQDENSVTSQYKEIVMSILDSKYHMTEALSPSEWSGHKTDFYAHTEKLKKFCQTHKDVLSANACQTIFADLEKFHAVNPPKSLIPDGDVEQFHRMGGYEESYGIYWGGPPK